MKSIYTLAAVAVAAAGTLNAQPAPDLCTTNLIANSQVIAKAQAASTDAVRRAILKAAIDANPANAVCLADLALQMGLNGNINPAGGPEEFGTTGETPTTTEDETPPAENPNQLNEPNETDSSSPAVPLPSPSELEKNS